MSLLAALVMLAALQDPEARYREALYHEVDAGDLQKAIDAYLAIESDSSAPEAVRAKAAFRRAWCLEKKGRRAEAERGYRDVAAKYPGQPETVEKAKERLDRLLAGAAPPAPVSQEQRIADHILNLGSKGESAWSSHRALVLIGEPAVPALRKAMEHKDIVMSAMAASVLVELEKDEETYLPLLRRLRSKESQYYAQFATLLNRSEPDRKKFAGEFNAERDPRMLDRFLHFLQWTDIPEVRPRLCELVVSGEKDLSTQAAGFLKITREDELFDLLEKMGKAQSGSGRVEGLLITSAVKVADPRRLAALVTSLIPQHGPSSYRSLHGLEPRLDVLRECILLWLKSGNTEVRKEAIRWVYYDSALRFRLALSLLGEPIDESERVLLVSNLTTQGGPPEPWIRAEVEKALWTLAEKEKGNMRFAALRGLTEMVPETHSRWEELFIWKFKVGTAQGMQRDYNELKAETQAKVRKLNQEFIAKGENDEIRLKAMHLSTLIDDPERFPMLADLAADESLSMEVRRTALVGLPLARDAKPFGEKLMPLLKHSDPILRRDAIRTFRNWRGEEMEKLMTGLLVDPDSATSAAAMDWFMSAPRDQYLDIYFKAFKSSSSWVRIKAAEATGAAESLSAVPHLIQLLDDPAPSVRDAARTALDRIRKRHEEKAQWLEWYERVKPK